MGRDTPSSKPDFENYIIIRYRKVGGIVTLSTGDGAPLLGVRESSKTDTMRTAIAAVYEEAIPLEVKL